MRRLSTILITVALVLGLAQCKKEQPTPQSEGVMITLNVGDNNNGSRANVNPTGTEQVTFVDGDQILVAYDGHYVGTLEKATVGSVSQFSGTINITQSDTDQPLYFYFLGNKQGTLATGATTCTVNISDQTTNAGLPVISMGRSLDAQGRVLDYVDGMTSFTSRLYNKCSLMKFNVTTPSTAAICITGMNNEVTVNFNPENEDERFEYGMNADDGGLIKMPAKDAQGATWAIVLPQPELAAGGIGTAYTEDTENQSNCYLGSRPSIPAISANQYIVSVEEEPISMTMNTPRYIDLASNPGYTAKNGQVLYGVTSSPISITAGATVTLAGVNITNSSSTSGAINCNGGGRTTLVLSGENFATTSNCEGAGIMVRQDGTLVIRGDGSLTATGGYGGAGIGSGYVSCGNIEIQGGYITATGGDDAAGIGLGGYNGSCGSITIDGGTVIATGGSSAPGISTYASITINDGHVEATGTGVAAGIGSGNKSFEDGECAISITGGTVIAQGGSTTNYGGAGIGSGSLPLKSNIIISGGNVSATGGTNSAGIGCGTGAVNADIIISGGTIYAKGTTASSIGPSSTTHNGDIVITSEVQSITAEITSGKVKCIGACHRLGRYSYSVTIDGHTYSTNNTGTFDPTGDVGNTPAFTGTSNSSGNTKTYTLTHK